MLFIEKYLKKQIYQAKMKNCIKVENISNFVIPVVVLK